MDIHNLMWQCPDCGVANFTDFEKFDATCCEHCFAGPFLWEQILTEDELIEVKLLLKKNESYWQVNATVNVIAIVKAVSREAAAEIVQNYEYNDDVEVEGQCIHFLDLEVTNVDPHTHQSEDDEDYNEDYNEDYDDD